MTDILELLRALSRHEHLDTSIGADAADEIERLRAEAADFHMTYRMKCDVETKAQAGEIERLQAVVTEQALQYLSAETQAHEAWEETQRMRAEIESLRPDAEAYRSMGGVVRRPPSPFPQS